MGEVVCFVEENGKKCGKKFDSRRALTNHITKKHPNFKQDKPKLFPITLSSKEKELWSKEATAYGKSLAEYIRFIMSEGVGGAEQVRKAIIEKDFNAKIEKIENDKRKVEQELEAMKNFFIREMEKKKKSKRLKIDAKKATALILERFKVDEGLERLEEQYVGDRLLEAEWDTLTLGQQSDARKLTNKMPLIAAIKKIKKKCSKDFEKFFAKELMSYGC